MNSGLEDNPPEDQDEWEVKRSKNSFWGDVWANCKRWLIKFVKTPPVIIMNLVQPILFMLLFTEVFGQIASRSLAGVNYATFLLPAIIMQVSIMTSNGAGINLVKDMDEWIFEKVMVSPMSKTAVFLGKTVSEIFRIIIQIGIILVLGVALGAEISTGVLGALGVIGIGILFSLIFTSLITIVAMISKDQETMMSIIMPVTFPLLFLSSAFLPLNELPGWIQTVAKVNPVTYGVDAARSIIMGKDMMTVLEVNYFSGIWNAVIPALLIMLGLGIVFGGLAVFIIKQETSSDVK